MKHITATSTSAAETKIFFIYICSIADIAETNFFLFTYTTSQTQVGARALSDIFIYDSILFQDKALLLTYCFHCCFLLSKW